MDGVGLLRAEFMMLEAQLVRWGIDSISVNPDAIERTRRNVAVAEQAVLLAAARKHTSP